MSVLTVVTPATSNDLVSLRALKQRLKVPDSADDANLKALISDASDAIATELNRVLGQEDLSEIFHSHPDEYGREGDDHFRSVFGHTGFQTLVLSRRPVNTVTSIADEGGNVIDPSLYAVTADAGLVRVSNDRPRAYVWDALWPHGRLTVAYNAGYTLPDDAALPRSLARACIRLVSHYRSSETRDPSVKSEEISGVSRFEYWVGAVGDNGALPPEVLDLIAKFRDPAV